MPRCSLVHEHISRCWIPDSIGSASPPTLGNHRLFIWRVMKTGCWLPTVALRTLESTKRTLSHDASSRSPNQPYRNLFIHCVSRGRCDVLAHILNSPQFTDRMQLSLLRNVCEHCLFLLITRWQSISFCCRSKNKWDRSTLEKSPPRLTPN